MPRGRAKPEPVVIPTNSVVASAARYPGKATRIYRPNQSWQEECYRHYSICGEARFAARFMGSALSKATLSVAKPSADGPVVQTASPAAQSLEALFHGADGQAQMLTALGVHLTIGGECYLVGRSRVEDKDTGEVRTDVWEVVSILEMKVAGTSGPSTTATATRRAGRRPTWSSASGPQPRQAHRGRLPVPLRAADPHRNRVAHPAHLRADLLAAGRCILA
jgi:hypothetical protein